MGRKSLTSSIKPAGGRLGTTDIRITMGEDMMCVKGGVGAPRSANAQRGGDGAGTCLAKDAAGMESLEEDFIQDVVQDANHIWIGLKVTPPGGKWTWVDGSPLDPVRFSGSADGNSCGWIKGSQVLSETCAAELKWICQKEAAVI
ncbi:unnamed protein product [Natator depressus]